MTSSARRAASIAVIGDFDPARPTHPPTTEAIRLAAAAADVPVSVEWMPTAELDDSADEQLTRFSGIFLAPGSPYTSLEGALAGIRVARETGRPFLGTCGGFQHAALEFARNVLGLVDAVHGEYEPDAAEPFIAPLACSLAEQSQEVRIRPDSRAGAAYGRERSSEPFRCSFGLRPNAQEQLDEAGLKSVGFDQDGESRIIELSDHPFFLATLFVPQIAEPQGEPHPLITNFVEHAAQAVTRY